MTDSPYWNPRDETMPRDRLDALQLHKLKRAGEWAEKQVPYHADRFSRAGVTRQDVLSLDDLRRLLS